MFIDIDSIIVVKCMASPWSPHNPDETTARVLDAATIEGKGSAALTWKLMNKTIWVKQRTIYVDLRFKLVTHRDHKLLHKCLR